MSRAAVSNPPTPKLAKGSTKRWSLAEPQARWHSSVTMPSRRPQPRQMKTIATEGLSYSRSEMGNKDGHVGGHFLRKGCFSGSLSLISSPTAKWSKTSTDDFHITEIVTPGQMFPERERFMISYFIFCHSLSPHFGSSRTEASWRAWKRALHTAQLPQCHCLPGIPWARSFPPSPHVIFYQVEKWKVLN